MAKQKGRGRVFVVSAPSGSGKTTLCDRLVKKDRSLIQSVSMTTRRPRRGERNKRDYFFVTEKKFKDTIRKNGFLEWARNFGCFYGTPRKFVIDKLKKDRDVILSIDVQGAMQVKKICLPAVFIFIAPPSFNELKKRLKKRNTEHHTSITKRLLVAKRELKYIPKYDYVVVNDSIKKALAKLKAIILKERERH